MTPFPIENLEEGMTVEVVRERFGEPVARDTVWNPGSWSPVWTYDAESSLTYVDEERGWLNPSDLPPDDGSLTYKLQTSVFWVGSVLLFPSTLLSILPNAVLPGLWWDSVYVARKPLVLYFEQEDLVRWEVIEPVPSSGYADPFPSTMTFPTLDSIHHDAGHKHHHGHK